MEDHELLSEYAEHHCDKAFAELVARHIDLVYSTAFRLVGESHLAQDVAQMVFIGLARKPRSLRNPRVLAGWLYHTTRSKPPLPGWPPVSPPLRSPGPPAAAPRLGHSNSLNS